MLLKPFPKKYLQRIKNFSNEYIQDVLNTCIRIHEKDQKAYPLRIFKSISKRWKYMHRYKITIVLNYLEYLGVLICNLEPLEEYKERMKAFPGLYEKGLRRKYFRPNLETPSKYLGKSVDYRKFSYLELDVPHIRELEYPV